MIYINYIILYLYKFRKMRNCDTNNQDVAIMQIHLSAVSAEVIFPISHDALLAAVQL